MHLPDTVSIGDAASPAGSALVAKGLYHIFRGRDVETVALRGVDVELAPATWTSVTGPSGSGKSTLVHVLCGLLEPQGGSVVMDGRDLTRMPPAERAGWRRTRIGAVLQTGNLHPLLSVADNVATPLRLAGRERADVRLRVDDLLARVGLAGYHRRRPRSLSGGETQRVALAVAFAARPAVVLADEPTGELDERTAEDVLDVLDRLRVEENTAILTVTHTPAVAARAGPVLEAVGLTRVHPSAAGPVRSLDDVSLAVAPGEVVAVTGPSGSGKSTLLFLLGGLDEPTAGAARIAGTDWNSLRGSRREEFRRERCGFIVQGNALLPQATAAENAEVPLLLGPHPEPDRAARVHEALERVGMAEHAAKLPDQLSGGQEQRVGVARALICRPAVLLADEPTAHLDSASAHEVVRLLVELARENGTAVVLVTHDLSLTGYADRVVRLHSGRLAS